MRSSPLRRVGRRSLLLVLLLSLAPLRSAWGASPLDQLQEDHLPATREALVAEACTRDAPVTPEELRPLFAAQGVMSAIDGARIVACREAPALVPLTLELLFASGDLGSLRDSDVHRRLVLGLQGFPDDVLRDAIHATDLTDIITSSEERTAELMQRLTGARPPPELVLAARPALMESARRFLLAQVGGGEPSFVRLLGESGDGLLQFDAVLTAAQCAVFIEAGDGAVVAGAAEIVMQGALGGPEIAAAIERRLAREDLPVLTRARDQLPNPGTSGNEAGALGPGYQVELPPRPPPTRSWERPARRALHLSLPGWVLVGALLLLVPWLAAVRRWPGARRWLFPLAAAGIAPVGVAAAELLLAALGVRPLAEVQPMINPNSVEVDLYEPRSIEGRQVMVSRAGNHRRLVFPARPREGTPRVVALGESSVHGHLLLGDDVFPAVLGAGLEERLGRPVEVINAGIPGALSDEILLAGLEVLELKPDVMVVYAGFNDLSHFPMMGEFQGWSANTIKVQRFLAGSRVARLAIDLLPTPGVDDASPLAHLDEVQQTAEAKEALRQLGVDNARANLLRLARAAERAGVRFVIATQGLREDCSGDQVCSAGDLVAIGRHVAARTDAVLVDTQAALGECPPPDGPEHPLHRCFYDDVHPSRLGHALIGDALVPTVARLLEP